MFARHRHLEFSVHGERSNWTVKITGPHGLALEDQTVERAWFGLFSELLASASESVKREAVIEQRRGPAAMKTAVDDFFDTLSFLLRPGDLKHNNGLIRDFAAMSGISEESP